MQQLESELTEAKSKIETLNKQTAEAMATMEQRQSKNRKTIEDHAITIAGQIKTIDDQAKTIDKHKKHAEELKSKLDDANSLGEKEYSTIQKRVYAKPGDKLLALQNFVNDYPLSPLVKKAESQIQTLKVKEDERIEAEQKAAAESDRAEKEKAAVRERVIKEAAAKFDIKKDEVKDLTWYTPKLKMTGDPFLQLYIGKKDNGPWLRFKVIAKEMDGMAFDSLYINADGIKYQCKVRTGGGQRVGGYGRYSYNLYTADMSVDTELLNFLQHMSKSTKVTARIIEDFKNVYRDQTISSAVKESISNTLDLYDAMRQ